jgi:protein-S-isoprenylcysteine O-methyltransferase Ste14
MKRVFVVLRAVLYLIGVLILWRWLALGVRRYDETLGVTLPRWTETPGIIVTILGGVLFVVCNGLFAFLGEGTLVLFDSPRKFVAVGPYRFVRNPMYLSVLTMLLGFGLYYHSASILLLAAAAFLLFHLVVVVVEGPGLKERFGESYLEYKKSVNRWRPKGPRGQRTTR